MAGLIKDNTPVKKPDISNPYQTPGSARATRPKRPRATGKPTNPKKQPVEEKKEKVYSPQAIIEATVPKVRPHHKIVSFLCSFLSSG